MQPLNLPQRTAQGCVTSTTCPYRPMVIVGSALAHTKNQDPDQPIKISMVVRLSMAAPVDLIEQSTPEALLRTDLYRAALSQFAVLWGGARPPWRYPMPSSKNALWRCWNSLNQLVHVGVRARQPRAGQPSHWGHIGGAQLASERARNRFPFEPNRSIMRASRGAK
jgi:hypothetical protein